MPFARKPGGRRKPIAAFERAADGRQRILALGELDDLLRRRLAKDRRQHAVVGRDESVVADVGGNAAARRADAGIDDDEEDGAGRKIAVARGELERAGKHVVRGNVVADVDQRRIRTDAEHDALERAGVMIAGAEISEESDGRPHYKVPRAP